MKTRADRRNNREKKIKQRSNLLAAFELWLDKDQDYNKLANNNEMNAVISKGKRAKTNTRKSHSNYRHKGGYGPANNYVPKDARQLDDINYQLKDM